MNLSTTHANLGLISDCGVVITQASLNALNAHYTGFDNCRFKIGNEMSFKALIGTTEVDLRQHFVDRCLAQGITVPTGSELGEQNLYMYRWVFANNASSVGAVIRDSIIDKFQKRRFIQLGWKSETVEAIPITTILNTVNSINAGFGNGDVVIAENSISLGDNIDISEYPAKVFPAPSSLMWLGNGRRKINLVNILHSLAIPYGVRIGSEVLSLVNNGQIAAGEFYLVRSANQSLATVTYNGVAYTSSLNQRNNIFVGIGGQSSWTTSDNVVVYKVLDLAVMSTIKVRTVLNLPPAKITSGALDNNYIYFVEPTDIVNPSGWVTYNGVNYPPYASFVYKGGVWSISGSVVLRRAYNKDFNITTETKDKAFWQGQPMLPEWYNVVPDDFSCVMENNNPNTMKIKKDVNGNYIASGYIGFYGMKAGDGGAPTPIYPIPATYLQIMLPISTLNPM